MGSHAEGCVQGCHEESFLDAPRRLHMGADLGQSGASRLHRVDMVEVEGQTRRDNCGSNGTR